MVDETPPPRRHIAQVIGRRGSGLGRERLGREILPHGLSPSRAAVAYPPSGGRLNSRVTSRHLERIRNSVGCYSYRLGCHPVRWLCRKPSFYAKPGMVAPPALRRGICV